MISVQLLYQLSTPAEMYCRMKQDILKSQTLDSVKLHNRRILMVTKWLEGLDHVWSTTKLICISFSLVSRLPNIIISMVIRSIHGSRSLPSRIIWKECWCFLICSNRSWGKLKLHVYILSNWRYARFIHFHHQSFFWKVFHTSIRCWVGTSCSQILLWKVRPLIMRVK